MDKYHKVRMSSICCSFVTVWAFIEGELECVIRRYVLGGWLGIEGWLSEHSPEAVGEVSEILYRVPPTPHASFPFGMPVSLPASPPYLHRMLE